MKIIGLCGGSGAGKGYVCEKFKAYNFGVIDTDRVYHDLISHKSDCYLDLVCEFGEDIAVAGRIDRARLAQIVFADETGERLERLNEITHSHILGKVRELLVDFKKAGVPAVLVDAPLLFESGFNLECDAVIGVLADMKIRVKRITARDKISEGAAVKRIERQKSDGFITAHSDFIIVNNGDGGELEKSIAEIASKILENGEKNNV